jgi:hypothetical protein
MSNEITQASAIDDFALDAEAAIMSFAKEVTSGNIFLPFDAVRDIEMSFRVSNSIECSLTARSNSNAVDISINRNGGMIGKVASRTILSFNGDNQDLSDDVGLPTVRGVHPLKPGVMSIVAPKGSGKTLLTNHLFNQLGDRATLVSMGEPESMLHGPEATIYLGLFFAAAKGDSVVGFDSWRTVLNEMDAKNLQSFGISRSFDGLVTDIDRMARRLGMIVWVTLNPSSVNKDAVGAIYEAFAGSASYVINLDGVKLGRLIDPQGRTTYVGADVTLYSRRGRSSGDAEDKVKGLVFRDTSLPDDIYDGADISKQDTRNAPLAQEFSRK